MKRISLFLLLLLSLSLTGWADSLSQCSEDESDCVTVKTGRVVQPAATGTCPATTNLAAKKTYALPSLQEFYYPLQAIYTPLGAVFGAKKREQKEIDAYWQTRQKQLDSENLACTELSDNADIKECLRNVRQVEMNKTAAIRSLNEQRAVKPQEWSLNYMRVPRQFNFDNNRVLNLKCRGYGDSTNCSNY